MKIASPPSTRGSQGHFKHQHPENRWEERPYYFCLNFPGQNLCDLNYNCKAGKKYNLSLSVYDQEKTEIGLVNRELVFSQSH